MDYSHTPAVGEIYKHIPELNTEDKALIEKAYYYARNAHDGQMRKSGEPYFNHVVATAINLAKLKMDVHSVCAGLLHDVLEDTDKTDDELRGEFGTDIYKIVDGVSKLGKLKYTGLERHVESLRKFFVAMSEDTRVVIVKLCDRLHNISTLEFVDPHKRRRIALETIEIHARLADRLGMGKLKAELEDLAFPYVYPEEYNRTLSLLRELRPMDNSKLEMIIETLKEELEIFDVVIDRVDHRIKHLYSLWVKLKKNNYDTSKVYDVVALRIIVPNLSECYQALGVIHSLYKPVPNRFKDYIAVPKPNGYQSLHTAVFAGDGSTIEIQIRTSEMHNKAEYGVASHMGYKEKQKNTIDQNKGDKKNKLSKNSTNKQSNILGNNKWAEELLELQKDVTKHDEYMERLHNDFFKNRVFVLTPKGDVIDLPEGSTPIDFAYHIHSEIGNHIHSTMVNNKMVSLNTALNNRDIVSIEIKDGSHPNRKWLDMCQTHMAKRHIRNYLREHGGMFDKLLIRK